MTKNKKNKASTIYTTQLVDIFKGYTILSVSGTALTSYIIHSIFKLNKLDAHICRGVKKIINGLDKEHYMVTVDGNYYDYNGLVDISYFDNVFLIDIEKFSKDYLKHNYNIGYWKKVTYGKKSVIDTSKMMNIYLMRCVKHNYKLNNVLVDDYVNIIVPQFNYKKNIMDRIFYIIDVFKKYIGK